MDGSFTVVSKRELRERFNAGDFWFRVQIGELACRLEEDGHPSPGPAGEPYCTRSQVVSYWDGDAQVARVHQYLRPDGQIGASGRPDPKMVVVEGAIYAVVDPD